MTLTPAQLSRHHKVQRKGETHQLPLGQHFHLNSNNNNNNNNNSSSRSNNSCITKCQCYKIRKIVTRQFSCTFQSYKKSQTDCFTSLWQFLPFSHVTIVLWEYAQLSYKFSRFSYLILRPSYAYCFFCFTIIQLFIILMVGVNVIKFHISILRTVSMYLRET